MRFVINPFTEKLDVASITGSGAPPVETLSGNDGVVVGANPTTYNIDVLGNNSTGINITGDAGDYTLTVAGIASSTTQVGTTAYATNAQAAAQSSSTVALTPSNITSMFSVDPLPSSQGGTGLSSPAAHSLIVTEGSSAYHVLGVAGNGQLPIGSVGSDPVLANITSTGGTITVTNGPGTINIDTSGTVDLTLTGNSGGAVSPTTGNIKTIGSGSITVVGNPGTSTLTTQLTGLTNNSVLVGAGTATITSLATADSAVLVTSAGGVPSISTTLPAGLTTTQLSITGTPSANTDATNVLYVQNALGTVNPGTSVYAATTVNIPGTYTIVGAGVGDTFLTTATGTFTLDGTTPALGSRILFKNQSTTLQNGVYTLTTNGTGITGSLFTRAVDYDMADNVNSTGVIAVVNGTVNQLTGWLLNVVVTTVSVSPITYVQYNAAPISTTQYAVLVGGSANTVVSVGPGSTSGVPLIAQGASNNPAFGTALVVGGGSGATSFNINGVVVSNTTTTGALASLTLSSGQIVIGGTTTPAAATLTAGTGISISNGNNSITISGAGGGFTWTDVTGGSATLAAQNGYKADSASLTTFTLPTNNALGDTIIIMGSGAGGWKIVYTTSQYIQFGSSATTVTTGNLASTNRYDSCTLVCIVASASAPVFQILSSVGNLSIT